jgi:WD40 repeat protein
VENNKDILTFETSKHNLAPLAGISFSPDGKYLATATGVEFGNASRFAGEVKVWDVQTGTEAFALENSSGSYSSVVYAPDGEWLAAADVGLFQKPVLKLWSAKTGKQTLTIQVRQSDVYTDVAALAVSPDGKRLVGGGFATDKTGGQVQVWDIQTAKNILTWRSRALAVSSLAFSGDGKWLATGSADGTVTVWDAETADLVATLSGHSKAAHGVAFSPDASRLASASWDGTVKLWDWSKRREAITLAAPAAGARSVAFSQDGKLLVSGGVADDKLGKARGEIKVWEAVKNQKSVVLGGKGYKVAFSPDGKQLATAGGRDCQATLWDARTGDEIMTMSAPGQSVDCIAFHPDGTRFAGGGPYKDKQGARLTVWDTEGGKPTLELEGESYGFIAVAFSPDGKRLAVNFKDPKVWDFETGRELFAIKSDETQRTVAFSPVNRNLATSKGVWDAQTGQPSLFWSDVMWVTNPQKYGKAPKPFDAAEQTWAWDQFYRWAACVAFSPDNKQLASGDYEGSLVLRDLKTGRVQLELKGNTRKAKTGVQLLSLAFSPDGKRLASGCEDGTLRLWGARTGREMMDLRGHAGSVTSVAFSPDGKRLASTDSGGTIIVWDVSASQ